VRKKKRSEESCNCRGSDAKIYKTNMILIVIVGKKHTNRWLDSMLSAIVELFIS
jgi:hypothetical protein